MKYLVKYTQKYNMILLKYTEEGLKVLSEVHLSYTEVLQDYTTLKYKST